MQSGQHPCRAACCKGKDIGHNGRAREEQRQSDPDPNGESTLPGEVTRKLRQHEQAQVARVEKIRVATELQTEKRRHFDGQRRGNGEAQDDERSVRVATPGSVAASGAITSCFHSRSECSRANSRESASRLPMRLTATSKGFVARQTCLGEHGHLVAEVAFKLLHVRAMDSTSVAEIHPPLRNLFLKG